MLGTGRRLAGFKILLKIPIGAVPLYLPLFVFFTYIKPSAVRISLGYLHRIENFVVEGAYEGSEAT